MGGPATIAHRLYSAERPAVVRTEKRGIVIVGGGIAGLSAAWALKKKGIEDFTILELHSSCGGNSLSGASPVSGYPWGAHYIPVPNRESVLVRELFDELKVTDAAPNTNGSQAGAPCYKEDFLCADPQERLYRLGEWQSGILPSSFLSQVEHDEQARFFELMHSFKDRVGSDGRPAFAIPLDLSSTDEEFRKLDTVPFSRFLDEAHLTSHSLRWYISYCCRDDYGCEPHEISAWAGIHYFAGRRGWSSNAEESDLLTWPEGNGWIVKQLAAKLYNHITTNALVHTIHPEGSPKVEYIDVTNNEGVSLSCEAIIFAAPRFTLKHVVPELRAKQASPNPTPWRYNPWMVANISMRDLVQGLKGSPGAPLAWDNVIYESRSLGYVVATHQTPRAVHEETVLTYYLPLSGEDPTSARKRALDTPWSTWRDEIVKDLSVPHKNIRSSIEQIDVWLWGHGMVTPSPGYLWGSGRTDMQKPLGRMWFAHSDMSGLSIFEEAQYRGVLAAQAVADVVKA